MRPFEELWHVSRKMENQCLQDKTTSRVGEIRPRIPIYAARVKTQAENFTAGSIERYLNGVTLMMVNDDEGANDSDAEQYDLFGSSSEPNCEDSRSKTLPQVESEVEAPLAPPSEVGSGYGRS